MDNASKNVTSDAYITVENLGDEADGAAQTCDIIVSAMEQSAADITKYLLAKAKGLDGIESLTLKYEEAKSAATAVPTATRWPTPTATSGSSST